MNNLTITLNDNLVLKSDLKRNGGWLSESSNEFLQETTAVSPNLFYYFGK